MTALPILAYWLVAAWGLLSPRPVLVYLFFATLPFGTLAVVPPEVTAGLTFVPAPMTALLLIAKTFVNRQRLLVAVSAALDARRLGILFAFWVVAVVVTVFMPRLFAGSVMIIPVRGDVSSRAPLYVTIQNISQLAYLTISIIVVFAFAQRLRTPDSRQTALHALVLGSAVTVATGVADFASQYLPLTPVLDLFRTATYALLTDVEVFGAKRVVGLMPEASSFGSLCLSMLCLLYFLRRAIRNNRIRDVYTPPLILMLLMFAWLSTSSATYVGLAVFAAMVVLEWLIRSLERRYSRLRRRHLAAEFWFASLLTVGVAVLLLVQPALFDSMIAMVDRMVFQKAETDSFTERSMWTAVSLQALFDTYGIGVGLGGTRASNSVVATFSNVGVVGAVFYFGFIIQSLLRRAARDDMEGEVLVSAMRYAFAPPFIVGLLIGTTPDFGAFGAFRYGLLAAIGLGSLYAGSLRPARRFNTPLVVR